MEIGVEWGWAGLGAAAVTGLSSYIILKSRLGHEQRIAAESALLASGPQIIAALQTVLASRDTRIDLLEGRNSTLFQEVQKVIDLNRDCEARCHRLTAENAEITRRLEALEKRNQ